MLARATLLLLAAAACQRAQAPVPGRAAPEAAVPRESCLDRELARRGLNPYGDPPDTVYAGGTPLFDERTGKRTDRAEHVFRKHPDIARACGTAD